MREIKFEYGFENHAPLKYTIQQIEFGLDFSETGRVKYRRQYTGLKDSRGVEIYEGDVVKWDDSSNGKYWRVAKVEWHDIGQWCYKIMPHLCINCFKDRCGDKEFGLGDFIYTPDPSIDGNALEVIGNIYENPELLEPDQ